MKLKLYSLQFIGTVFVFISCKTAGKLYEKGNYDEAVELAAKKLQKDPDDPKLLNIIRESYKYAVNDHESRIRSSSESNNEMKWEWMYNDYAALQRMYDAIRKVPSVNRIVKPADYSSYLITYGEKAGDVRYDRGLSFMQRSDKQSYRQAYNEFQVSLKLKPGNRDAIQKMDEAYEYAVTNVVVLPVERGYGFHYSSYNGFGSENFDDLIFRNLQYNSNNRFVRFYRDWDARTSKVRVDQVLDMRLSTVNIGRYTDNRSTRRVSKEVVIKEIVYRPDSIVKVFGTVYADITTTKRCINSDGTLQVNVTDAEGRWVWSDNFRGDHRWETEFATYTGDERALSDADRQLINSRPQQPPHEDEIMRCILSEINNNALYRIKNYFNRI
jgi:hypothetical protein